MYCPFCWPEDHRVVATSRHGIALRDAFPVTEGHTLVIPRAHVGSVFDLGPEEQADLWALVARVRADLTREGAAAFTIGVNDGRAAGQTMSHAHIHVIPRRPGDHPDPRGGIRWVIPERADYWSSPRGEGGEG